MPELKVDDAGEVEKEMTESALGQDHYKGVADAIDFLSECLL